MEGAMTRDEIFAKVKDMLVDALVVDEDEVTPQARLTVDLGAESIDFLDIVFRLQQAFGITIPQGELFPEGVAQNTDYVREGKVTPAGIAAPTRAGRHPRDARRSVRLLQALPVGGSCRQRLPERRGGLLL